MADGSLLRELGMLAEGAAVSDVRGALRRDLEAGGVGGAKVSAQWVMCDALGVSKSDLEVQSGRKVTGAELAKVREFASRRIAGEPLQYITGHAPFRYLDLKARPGVFIPRPETEVLVEIVLECLGEDFHQHIGGGHGHAHGPEGDGRTFRVLDLCCGSGTVAVSVATERDNAQVTAIDVSEEAVALAGENAEAAGVADRVRVLCGDLFAPIEAGEKFDIIAANPPYIPTRTLATMPREVTEWEPRAALDGGDDGLDTFRRILDGLADHLAQGGIFVCELDETNVIDAARMCAELRGEPEFSMVDVCLDLADRPRVLFAQLGKHVRMQRGR